MLGRIASWPVSMCGVGVLYRCRWARDVKCYKVKKSRVKEGRRVNKCDERNEIEGIKWATANVLRLYFTFGRWERLWWSYLPRLDDVTDMMRIAKTQQTPW